MPKKKSSIKKITAKELEDDYLQIELTDKDGKTQTVKSKIYSSGKVKFKIKHPDIGEELSYEGIVENSNLYIYPLIDWASLSRNPIKIR
jgi:hypothetical protein